MTYLTVTTSLSVAEVRTAEGLFGAAQLTLSITDSRPFLSTKHVQYSIDWGDGTQTSSDKLVSPVVDEVIDHQYPEGQYTIQLTVVNFATPQEVSVRSLAVDIQGFPLLTPLYEPIIRGPVLPNSDSWNFDMATDASLLASNARLLFITEVGERLMNPSFGSRLRQMLFNPLDSVTDDQLSAEIGRVLAEQEPRLNVLQLTTNRSERSVAVDLVLRSTLDNRTVKVATQINP